MTKKVLIEMNNIVKDFASGEDFIRVLHGISLQLSAGELSMFVGPSGCGKTTLLSIMTGILTPTDGNVLIGGTDINSQDPIEKIIFRRRNFGFIFQQFHLLPALTAAENVAIPLLADDVPFKDAIERSIDMLKLVDLADHIYKLPSQLSGGQQQRVAFCRALVHNPKIIVCDEPTSALDAHTGHHIMEVLRKIAIKPDSAVVVVTHDNRIFEFANRMFYMSDGQIDKEEFKY